MEVPREYKGSTMGVAWEYDGSSMEVRWEYEGSTEVRKSRFFPLDVYAFSKAFHNGSFKNIFRILLFTLDEIHVKQKYIRNICIILSSMRSSTNMYTFRWHDS